jgi:CTP synthase
VARIYGAEEISERHRHRYEFNNEYRIPLGAHGLVFSGISPDGQLVEMIEIPKHPWFIGCQFHPELKSRPTRPHPLFASFVEAAALRLGHLEAESTPPPIRVGSEG